jgi:hypothetical protein
MRRSKPASVSASLPERHGGLLADVAYRDDDATGDERRRDPPSHVSEPDDADAGERHRLTAVVLRHPASLPIVVPPVARG